MPLYFQRSKKHKLNFNIVMVAASRSIIFELYTHLFQKAMGLSKTNYTQIHTRARVLTGLHVYVTYICVCGEPRAKGQV